MASWRSARAHGQWSQAAARLGLTTASQQGPSAFAPLVTAQAERLRALCSAWPHGPGVAGTVRSAVPVVFLNGTADPPANVAAAAATMPNALLVSVPGTGHWILANAAATTFIQAGRPARPGPGNACARAMPPGARAIPRGSGPYSWLIAVSARAGNGAGGPPGTQDGTRGATGPQAGSRAVTGDTCEAHVPAAEDRATSSSRDMRQSGPRPVGDLSAA
jgi:TAP-like protein